MTLREYLEMTDTSLREFARLINKPRSTVQRWISGENDISLRDAYKVLLFTDGYVCPHDFMEEIEKRESTH
tara:strand:- start:1289 stop:1501 length:213 start_codon:yes stop_codon:yes gene_type:complete